ncbi:MAG: hypothetical protein AAGH57_12525 [Pseudomonadota bacterium]
MIPDHLWRHPTRAAIDALALRFGLPNTPDMQDWEHEVADSRRIDEFLAAYQSGILSDDERFTLMETIIQSFENLAEPLESDSRWPTVLELLNTNIRLHAKTVWYWALPDESDNANLWAVSLPLRPILETHRSELLALG